MATLEEKILAYLDGSLPEADREDVLAEISSGTGSERQLFDAHLRLQELYSLVQKPVSAPLTLQRELASKIPVLAIKLPYLAAPPQRRDRVTAGWVSSMRPSRVNMFLLAAIAVLIGGVWYFANNNGNTIHSGTAVTNTNSATANSSSSVSSPAANSSAITSDTHINQSAMNNAATNKLQNPASTNNGNLPDAGTGHSAFSRSIISERKLANRSTPSSAENKRPLLAQSTLNNGSSSVPNAKLSPVANTPLQNNPHPESEPVLSPLDLHAVDIPLRAVSMHPDGSILKPYPDEDNSSGSQSWHVYETQGARFVMSSATLTPYVAENKVGITGNTVVPSFEAGAEYEITPWTSAGARVGWTTFAQYQPITYNPSSVLYRQVLDNDVALVPAFWCALSATETFNPQDRLQYALSIAGGPELTQPLGWLGMAEASAAYDISQSLMLRFGVSFDISRIDASSANVNASHDTTVGFSTASSDNTLISRAFGLTLGLSFHP